MIPAPVLDIRNLSVTLHRGAQAQTVLAGVDLAVAAGEVVAVLGQSGSGKSTLAYAVMGLLDPEARPRIEGSIKVAGDEVIAAGPGQLRAVRRERLGVVFQDPIGSLNPALRVGDQLGESLGQRPAIAAADWLDRVGVADPVGVLSAFPHQLSGGQCQRVMIAMALAKRPALIIADEPTTALDVVTQAQVLVLLRQLAREEGVGMLFITHDLGVASVLADRCAIMHRGRLVEVGAFEAVIAQPGHPYTSALLGARFGLDADKRHPLQAAGMETTPASAAGSATGCGFASQCPLVTEACRAAPPPSSPARHGGLAACLRTDEVGPQIWRGAPEVWAPVSDAPPNLALEMAGIEKAFPGRGGRRAPTTVLNGINLRIRRGESVALVGASGSGKSTLLRIAAGLTAPTAGDVVLPSGAAQVVFQDAAGSFTPWLSIGEQIGERLRPLGLSAAERRARIEAALALVGLDPQLARRRSPSLSGGQCQRAALARAIVVPPPLLLCDEAVSAMDMGLAAAVLNLIANLRRKLGMGVLFVTHDLAAARFVADRILVMAAG